MPQDEPDEHLRFAAYLDSLEHVPSADELTLVRRVLTDEHRGMAQSAVLRHMDRRAEALLLGADFAGWAASIQAAVDGHPFLSRRLQEWGLLRAIALRLPWQRDALLAASDWLQLRAAAGLNAGAVALLAEHGRTKRVRGTARSAKGTASAPMADHWS
ncbi:hypothetical protein [Actinacidiphila acidipaludis]|uniref:hypothetical protein n=1 Tax=Actinacidiphila acidipaludis TaxID=2873382 RepID=UPI00223C0D02|nr:hypothetical protein [Streptomyces acidipaludis]